MNISDSITLRINNIIEANNIEIKDQDEELRPLGIKISENESDFALINVNRILINKIYKTKAPLNLRIIHEFTHIVMNKLENSRAKVLNPLAKPDSFDYCITFLLMTLRLLSIIISKTKHYQRKEHPEKESYADCIGHFIYYCQIIAIMGQKFIKAYLIISEISLILIWIYLIFFFHKPILDISKGITLTITLLYLVHTYLKYDKDADYKYHSIFELI